MKNGRFIIFVSLLLVLRTTGLFGQIFEKSTPRSFREKVTQLNNLPFKSMPSYDYSSLIREDTSNANVVKPYRYAKCFEVNYSLKNSGLWETLANGDRIWRLGIKSKGAYSLKLNFSEYEIPDGARVFVYNKDTSQIIGAFTSHNNSASKDLSISPVSGEEIIVEYDEPINVSGLGNLAVGIVCHDYRGLFGSVTSTDGLMSPSGPCEVDINCPEGANWQNHKHAICRISIVTQTLYAYYCTGSLINNTNADGRAYVLTANHCICDSYRASHADFVFNYENSICSGGTSNVSQTTHGATLRAANTYSDFTLVELNSVPTFPFMYYLGWDRSGNNPPVPATCIHHPNFDVKKISYTNNALSSQMVPFTFDPLAACVSNVTVDTWHLNQWATGVSGRTGVVEQGSSGAPLFDNNKRVIGQLTGGDANCGTSINDYFGRFSTSWNHGGSSTTELKEWLDPSNSGVTTLNGQYPYYISQTSTVYNYYCNGSNITFTLNNPPTSNPPNTVTFYWTCDGGLTPVGSTTGTSCTFQVNSGGTGYQKVYVALTAWDNSVLNFSGYTGWLGPPCVQSISGPRIVKPNVYNTYTANANYTNGTSYHWYVNPTGPYMEQGYPNNNEYITFYSLGYYEVMASAYNNCGETTRTGIQVDVTSSGNIVIVPNPTSDALTVTIQEASSLLGDSIATGNPVSSVVNTPTVYNVTIVDYMGNPVFSAQEYSKSFVISVQNFQNGNYILRVDDGTNQYSKQFVVKH